MGWFNSSLDDRSKVLVAEAVAGYCERARLSYQLLTIRPGVTANEMAVLWAAVMVNWENARAQNTERTEIGSVFDSTANDFFHSVCQGYIENVCGSTLKLDISSLEITAMIHPTMTSMPSERVERLGHLVGALSSNACELAASTIKLLSASLTNAQSQAAKQHALSLVQKDAKLNPFERQKASEWLAALTWERASI